MSERVICSSKKYYRVYRSRKDELTTSSEYLNRPKEEIDKLLDKNFKRFEEALLLVGEDDITHFFLNPRVLVDFPESLIDSIQKAYHSSKIVSSMSSAMHKARALVRIDHSFSIPEVIDIRKRVIKAKRALAQYNYESSIDKAGGASYKKWLAAQKEYQDSPKYWNMDNSDFEKMCENNDNELIASLAKVNEDTLAILFSDPIVILSLGYSLLAEIMKEINSQKVMDSLEESFAKSRNKRVHKYHLNGDELFRLRRITSRLRSDYELSKGV